MGNEHTKKQLRDFFKKAYDEARNPDPRTAARRLLKKKRQEKSKIVEKSYGLG